MSACYSCQQILNGKSRSFEHIIPNSIGGMLKSDRLICRECNSAYGMTIDAALAKDFENLAAFIHIERDRTKNYIIKNTVAPNGDLYHLENGRNPVPVKPTIKFENGQLYIAGRSKEQVIGIASGLKRKFPDIDMDSIERNFRDEDVLLDHELKINFSVGSDLFFRAVAKIAVSYYLMKARGRQYLNEIISVINGATANNHHIHYYPADRATWLDNEISHVISIKGDASLKQLYAHVILFNTYSFVVNLSDCYEDDDIDLFYRYDIIRQEEIKDQLDLSYNRQDFWVKIQQQRAQSDKDLVSSVQRNLGRVLHIAEQRQATLSLREIIDRTLDKAIAVYPAGTVITQDILNEINRKVLGKIHEFMSRGRD